MRRNLKILFSLMLLIFLDHFLKRYTFDYISMMSWKTPNYPFGGIGIFELGPISFSLNYVQNQGAAWGLFSSLPNFLLTIRGTIILGLFVYLVRNWGKNSLALWTIFFGAIANFIDYFLYGHVIDMFHFCFWGYTPFVFNLADSMISLGMVGLFFEWFKQRKVQSESSSL